MARARSSNPVTLPSARQTMGCAAVYSAPGSRRPSTTAVISLNEGGASVRALVIATPSLVMRPITTCHRFL